MGAAKCGDSNSALGSDEEALEVRVGARPGLGRGGWSRRRWKTGEGDGFEGIGEGKTAWLTEGAWWRGEGAWVGRSRPDGVGNEVEVRGRRRGRKGRLRWRKRTRSSAVPLREERRFDPWPPPSQATTTVAGRCRSSAVSSAFSWRTERKGKGRRRKEGGKGPRVRGDAVADKKERREWFARRGGSLAARRSHGVLSASLERRTEVGDEGAGSGWLVAGPRLSLSLHFFSLFSAFNF